MSISKELAELKELHESGALTDEEFAAAKEKILGASATDSHAELEPIEEVCEPVKYETTEGGIKSFVHFILVCLCLGLVIGATLGLFNDWRADELTDIDIATWTFLIFCSMIVVLNSKWAKAALPDFLKGFGNLIF